MSSPAYDLWDVFADGQSLQLDDGSSATIRIEDAGTLVLPTGKIVLSDPILDPFQKPFNVGVPPGNYRVLLSCVEQGVAFVMVSYEESKPNEWRQTTPTSFTTDSACGCLMDSKVNRFLFHQAEKDKYEKYCRHFESALDEGDGWFGNYCINAESGANVILFPTYGGDGAFASYFGYDANSNVVCLVVDMLS